jgi:heptosyltransferase-2
MGLKVLIRTPNHLGDCIMALPMVSETREVHPGSQVTILAPESLVELFTGNPGIDEIIPIPAAHVHGLIGVFKVKELIAKGNYDVGYILPPSFGAASGFKLAGVKERIGYVADGRRLLLTRPITLPEPLNSQHRSVVYFDLLRRGSLSNLDYAPPRLTLNDEDQGKANDILASVGLTEQDKYVAVAHQAVAQSRRWGIDNYASLVQRIIGGLNLHVVLIGSPADRESGEEVKLASLSESVHNLAGMTSLRESAAVLARSEAFVGNDSGPAHLAAAVGAKSVVLSGADDPNETSPISSCKTLIRRGELSCISCVKNVCPLNRGEQMRCMKLISVDDVYAAVRDWVRQG